MKPVLAHAGTPDELAATLLIFAAIWVAWAAWSRLRGKGFPRMPRGVALGLIPVAGALLVASAVVPGVMRAAMQRPVIVTGPRPRSTATLAFANPKPGGSVSGTNLPVVLRLTGGTIVNTASTNLQPDQGHIHLSVDGRLVSMTYGTLQTIDISKLSPGKHELEAEFVASDHGPFNPRVTASVSFEVSR